MQNNDLKLWHAIYETPGVGEGTVLKLMRAFPNPETALGAGTKELSEAGLAAREQTAFENARSAARRADSAWEILHKQNISVTAIGDDAYPRLLKEIPDPPPLLYSKGNITILNEHPCIAIVGTRKPTDYGRHVTLKLAEELSRAGLVVVSGLALGLDAVAHQGALEARGLTAAVLGNGLAESRIAPRNHLALARTVAARGGCLISEFPPDTQAGVGTFPMRNRVVAGLTLGAIVVEAAEKSGTLITARLALDYNREVFAVPGSILSPLSQGANALLKRGAHAVTSSQDILEILQLSENRHSSQEVVPENLGAEEQKILRALSNGPLFSQEIARQTNLSTVEVNTNLTILEINGFIREIGSGKYIVNYSH